MDTLLWTNKVRSSVYLVLGSLLILGVTFMLNAGTPLLTGENIMSKDSCLGSKGEYYWVVLVAEEMTIRKE